MSRRMPWATVLWPGLPQLWISGSWHALAIAVASGAMLDLALLGSLGYGELMTPQVRNSLWVGLGVTWTIAAVFSLAQSRRRERGLSADDPFAKATEYYLKGNWFEAERMLAEMLRQDARDVDARLMWATLLRHTGRLDDASEQLSRLSRMEDAKKWQLEIENERKLLAEARVEDDTPDDTTSETATTPPSIEPDQAA